MLIRILLLALTLGQATALMGSPSSISYSGRITDKHGTPTPGPIDLTIKFFNAKTAGNQLGTTKSFTDVPVINGVFQIEITLNDGDRHGVFGSSSEVWIEVSTPTIVYPRQTYHAVPYALKVPISGSLKYDSKGNLTVDTSTVDLSKNESQVKFTDGSGGASVTLKASGTDDLTWTMPPNNGAANQVLKTDGSGNLTWAVDATAGAGTIDSLALTNDSIANIDINSAANIDASKLGTGVVSNTEFNYLNGVTSGIQGQIDNKVSKSGDSGADLEFGTNSPHRLTLETGGNPRLTILANGSVGIGTTAPTTPLQVAGDVAITRASNNSVSNGFELQKARGALGSESIINDGDSLGVIAFKGYDTNSYEAGAQIEALSDGAPGDGDLPGALSFQTTLDGTTVPVERMRIDNSGNVGIGTTEPGQKLHVEGPDTVVELLHSDTATTGRAIKQFSVLGKTWDIGQNSDALNVGSFVLREDGAQRLTVLAGGNFGIGTTAPLSKFEVADNGFTEIAARSSAVGTSFVGKRSNGTLGGPLATTTNQNLALLQAYGYGDTGFAEAARISMTSEIGATFSDTSSPGRISFATSPSGATAPVSRMTIDSIGNVGIGTTAPGVPLDVAGDIRSSNGNVDYEVRKLLATSINNDDFYVLLAEKNTAQVRIQGEIIGLRTPSASAANIGKISVLFASDAVGTGFGGHVATSAGQEAGGYIGASLVEVDYSGSTYVAVKGTRIDGINVSWDGNIEFRGIALNGDLTVVDAASTSNEQPFSGTEGITSYMQTRVGVGTTAPNSSLQVNGSLATKLVVQSSDYTLTENDQLVTANAGAGNVVITLPTAVGIPGRTYTVKRTDGSGNSLTLATTGGQTIDGSATKTMLQYQYYTVVSDGAGWSIIGSNAAASGSPSGTITGSCTFGGGSTGTATCVFNSGMTCAAGNTARVFNLCNPGGTCTWNSSNTWPIGVCVKD